MPTSKNLNLNDSSVHAAFTELLIDDEDNLNYLNADNVIHEDSQEVFGNDNQESEMDEDTHNDKLHPESMQAEMNDADLEDFELKSTNNYSYEKGYLCLLCDLKSGEHMQIPFEQLRKD